MCLRERKDYLLDSKKLVDMVVDALQDKKAKEINIINIENISILADYFVICSGTSSTHLKALADSVEEKAAEAGYTMLHKEGYNSFRWILLDYGEVVVHIFHDEDRKFYNLERLWSDGIITYK
jgi:ribosome-associated protein